MASGTLGQANLTAATNTNCYTVGSTPTVFNVNIVNTNSTPVGVNLAIAASTTPTAGEYLEYQTVIPANGVLERGGIVGTASKQVVAYANTSGVSVNVYGYEG